MTLRERLDGVHREIDALAAHAAREREERLRGLQLAGRSLRQAESTEQWAQILADAAAPLAGSICFLRIDGDTAAPAAARQWPLPDAPVPLAAAPAMRQAVDTRETVVALCLPSQIGPLGEAGSRRRAHLFPLVGRTRVLGVLIAAGDAPPDTAALEVLISLAAASLELRESRGASLIQPALSMTPTAPAAHSRETPPVSTGPAYARRTVARWLLDEAGAIAGGRARGELYAALRGSIDAARAEYSARFLPGLDHLHLEMLARLAQGNAAAMGPDYPGPLGAGDAS